MIRYQITDGSASTNERRWLSRLRQDVDFIQIREKDLNARDLVILVRRAVAAVPGPRILVNDRADVTMACGAAGVHLRGGSVPPEVIRGLASLVITVACHSETDVINAQAADFVLVSPIFLPLSKHDSHPPLGISGLRRMVALSRIPVLALGGITDANARDCMAAGASGIAAISLFG